MSGGHWDYLQYRFTDVSEDVKKLIDRNGKEKTKEELYEWHNKEWYEEYPEEKYHTKFSDEALELFVQAYKTLREAQIYMQRIDWLLSGDDGEESFISRTKEDLEQLNK
jgi:hypothetical protein